MSTVYNVENGRSSGNDPTGLVETLRGQKRPDGDILIQFSNVDLQQVLPIYQELIGGTVDIPESVKRMHSLISLTNNEPMSRAQVVQLLENALQEQANVVATHTGSNHTVLSLHKSR
jgi:hypothetical protein